LPEYDSLSTENWITTWAAAINNDHQKNAKHIQKRRYIHFPAACGRNQIQSVFVLRPVLFFAPREDFVGAES
jgi:hypothetical protein